MDKGADGTGRVGAGYTDRTFSVGVLRGLAGVRGRPFEFWAGGAGEACERGRG